LFVTAPAPLVSVVIPIYNEEPILRSAVCDLCDRLASVPFTWEVVLSENGSRDGTLRLAGELAERYPQLVVHTTGEPNYGRALREGIMKARGEYILCDEIDLCDVDFHLRAVELLSANQADVVIGSKLIAGAADERPLLRHAASQVYSVLLRVLLGFQGTDTHGLKALRRSSILPIVEACVVDRDVFASELVIRAERARLRMMEIPVRVMEKRTPSINLLRRIPRVLSSLARLTWAIRANR
jgi:glycosyltransferase involved in cell wall biosynthesis